MARGVLRVSFIASPVIAVFNDGAAFHIARLIHISQALRPSPGALERQAGTPPFIYRRAQSIVSLVSAIGVQEDRLVSRIWTLAGAKRHRARRNLVDISAIQQVSGLQSDVRNSQA